MSGDVNLVRLLADLVAPLPDLLGSDIKSRANRSPREIAPSSIGMWRGQFDDRVYQIDNRADQISNASHQIDFGCW
jgi:hypothetical protein